MSQHGTIIALSALVTLVYAAWLWRKIRHTDGRNYFLFVAITLLIVQVISGVNLILKG